MPKFFKGVDWILLLTTIFLSSLGLLMIYSSSISTDGVDLSFVLRQAVFLLVGVVLYLIITNIDYRFMAQAAFFLYLGTIGLLVLTLFFGQEIRGSVRWIDLNIITIQVSEIAKPILVLTLATYFSKYSIKKLRNILASFIIMAIPVGLIFVQPDLGNASILTGIWVILIFFSGIRVFHIIVFSTLSVLIAPVLWNFLLGYQKERVSSFLNPQNDPLGSGYNIVQSIIAVGSGGLTGRGFGRGPQSQLNFLPEQKTDFIFATTAEELGFLGVSLILGSFIIIIYRIYLVFSIATDSLGSLIPIGVVGILIMHLFINIGMNVGIFPVTGITLPFLSFGGSSIISFMISLGLVNSIAAFPSKRRD